MKKYILSILVLIVCFGHSQTLIKLKQLEKSSPVGSGSVIVTDGTGTPTYSTIAALGGSFVPYNGATGSVNLNTQSLIVGASTLVSLVTGSGTFTGQVTASNVISAGTGSFGSGTSTFSNVTLSKLAIGGAIGTPSFLIYGTGSVQTTFTVGGVLTGQSNIMAAGSLGGQLVTFNSGDGEIRTVSGTYGLRLRGYNSISGALEDKFSFQSDRAKTGANYSFSFTPTSFTNQTASTEAPIFAIGAATIGHATGAISGDRDFYLTTVTHSAVGASTITNHIGAEFPAATSGSNVTLVNPLALHSKGNFSVTGHIAGGGTAPTIASGAGLGTGAGTVVSVTNATDLSGIIGVVTGTASLGTSAVLATVTFNSAYGVAPNIIITPANISSANLQASLGSAIHAGSTVSVLTLNTNTVALTAGATYSFYYHVVQ